MTARDVPSSGGAMSERLQRRSGREVRANLVCILCARTVGRACGPVGCPLTLTSIRVLDASSTDLVRRLRCPYCLGRVWLQDREEIYVEQYALDDADFNPRRGRPRKVAGAW